MADNIESHLKETRVFKPSKEFSAKAHIKSMAHYKKLWTESVKSPTSALDDGNCEQVMSLLFEVAVENNSTLIVATHDQRLKSKIKKHIQL